MTSKRIKKAILSSIIFIKTKKCECFNISELSEINYIYRCWFALFPDVKIECNICRKDMING